LAAVGVVISVTVKDNAGLPVPGILATDFWVIGWGDTLNLCGGGGSANADSASNSSGQTTMSGAIAAGGCDSGLQVVVQGVVLADPTDWSIPLCLPIIVHSPDISGDLLVDIVDFVLFTAAFTGTYNPCADYDCNALIDIVDFVLFTAHFNHLC
jgi:hypothetical protein